MINVHESPILFALSEKGAEIAKKAARSLGASVIGLEGRVLEADRLVPSIGDAIRDAFADKHAGCSGDGHRCLDPNSRTNTSWTNAMSRQS